MKYLVLYILIINFIGAIEFSKSAYSWGIPAPPSVKLKIHFNGKTITRLCQIKEIDTSNHDLGKRATILFKGKEYFVIIDHSSLELANKAYAIYKSRIEKHDSEGIKRKYPDIKNAKVGDVFHCSSTLGITSDSSHPYRINLGPPGMAFHKGNNNNRHLLDSKSKKWANDIFSENKSKNPKLTTVYLSGKFKIKVKEGKEIEIMSFSGSKTLVKK